MSQQRVLVVEDDKVIATIFKMYLLDLGHELVGSAANGNRAIELVDQLNPDIVLMDIMIEGNLSGIETTDIILKKHDIPILYCTSETDPSTVDAAMRNSFGYLVKPVSKTSLGINIEMASHQHQIHRHLRNAQRNFEAMFENLPLPFFVVSRKHVLFSHPKAASLFGYDSKEAFTGLDLSLIGPEETCNFIREFIQQGEAGPQKLPARDFSFLRNDGQVFEASVEMARIFINEEHALQLNLQTKPD